MKKILGLVLIMILFVTCLVPQVFADVSDEQEIWIDQGSENDLFSDSNALDPNPESDLFSDSNTLAPDSESDLFAYNDASDPDHENDLFADNDASDPDFEIDLSDNDDDDTSDENTPPALPDNGIPVVIIEIDESDGHTIDDMNSSMDHSVECYGTMEIRVPKGFSYCDMGTDPQSLSPVKLDYIRGRGNSTWDGYKRPYKIKLNKKQKVLGMGENKHWVLLANKYDTTSFKNRFTGWLGDALGLEYTPRGVSVDVVMVAKRDGKEIDRHNLGNYLLAEQVRVDKNRVDINELTADDTADITGGYLVQFGTQTDANDPDKFYTDHDISLANVTPTFDPADPDYTNENQKEYIRTYIQNMENALFGVGAQDGNPYVDQKGIRYNEYMDMKSAALYWLIQEAAENSDMYGTGSTYFYKKEEQFDDAGNKTEPGRIFWGPLWDFDLAWGDPEYPDRSYTGFSLYHDWLLAMACDEDENGFRETVKRLWPDVRDTILSALEPDGLIDRYYEELKDSYSADYEIWNNIETSEYKHRTDFAENAEGFKIWVRNRINWMDVHILGNPEDGYPDLDHTVSRVTFMADEEVFRQDYCKTNSYYSVPDSMDTTMIPEKEGFVFLGWHGGDGNLITSGQMITEDTTFYALIIPEEEAIRAEQIVFRSSEEWYDIGGSVGSFYTILPSDAQDRRMTWSSSDSSIAEVDQEGNVELLGAGTVTITATLHSGVTGSYELTVLDEERPMVENLEFVSDEIRLKPGEYAHVDYRILPRYSKVRFVLFYSENNDVATADWNGVVTACAPGTTRIFVQVYYPDENGYEVCIEKSCTVIVDTEEDDQPVSIAGWEVELSKTKFIYNAKIQKPVIRTIGGRKLKEGQDYTVKWTHESSKRVGTYRVFITGKGNYTGVTKASYKIRPKGTTLGTLTGASNAVIVRWTKQAEKMAYSKITGYQIQLATDSKFTKNKKTVTVKGYRTVSKKIGKLKSRKEYYVRIRTYKIVKDVKYFSPWSKAQTVKTK